MIRAWTRAMTRTHVSFRLLCGFADVTAFLRRVRRGAKRSLGQGAERERRRASRFRRRPVYNNAVCLDELSGRCHAVRGTN